ncbi:MAG: hypothetical protein ACI4E1_09950 [Lachnospira sp.]
MVNKRFKNIVKRFFCMFGTTALVAVSVAGCDNKRASEEKVLSDVNDDIEDVEIEEDIRSETFEKDGVTYNKVSGVFSSITYPVLEGAEYKEKVNDGLVYHSTYSSGLSGVTFKTGDNEDIGVVSICIGIEPFYFDESHSKLLSSTEEVSYITYQLYNARAYLYTSLYGLSNTDESSIIPRDESVLGLSEPTEKIPNYYPAGKYYDIVSNPVSLINTDFQCGRIYNVPGEGTIDKNVYLVIQFLFEESYENCSNYTKKNIMVSEELDKAILEAEIHYKNGETEKKYIGFKSYNGVNPEYYDVYTVEIE